MDGTLISCIIPVYNGERYLGEALDSILAQNYRPLEIIVADDGSTDKTKDIVLQYQEQKETDSLRMLYVKQANAGPAAARNLGVSTAKGEFVAFLDADDLWHPSKLVTQMNRFQVPPGLDYCLAYVQNFWIPELKKEAETFRQHRIAQPLPGYVTGTLLARRALFDCIGGFDVSLGHGDAGEWILRADRANSKKEVLQEILLFRRLHSNNRSRLRAVESRDQHLQILKAHLDRARAPKE